MDCLEINSHIISRKLDFLNHYLNHLESFRFIVLADYLKNSHTQLVVERLLHLASEVALDVNLHLLNSLGISQTKKDCDLFLEISKYDILELELAENLESLNRLRNQLIYLYDEIDPVQVYNRIELALQEYPKYQRQIIQYLDPLEDDRG
ncbi:MULTISPECIES: type VII toxin-antitoxin system HepT family RNase toxin [unclassified Roseofilum]|uniref:type VII toxin-antitoxin system HepT family RNase toxin n=1 Tax=unclassified Roseofilum TaxID=2620099 RepID=UPI000E83A6BD|nr:MULTISPECIES: HepT-like ribonuclease domain-containing protein [unclassified Roseofilum]MBP0009084.1 DUF86 domain-containing protein [Roseofilum sp. Belize Diploria]MBP0031698.1 DUF86 domain-containing protein [Roseofilum sp. Belize BBD 4]HBQ97775.1 DUF86 domain-containing protein [Cyanobacteria bacterium UBA11691]